MAITVRPAVLGAAFLLLGFLTGCAGGGTPQEAREDDVVEGQPDDAIQPDDCLIGEWLLDVDDYGAQSEAYLTGLGIPITEFAMDGGGILAFGMDGTVALNIDLTTTGVLVAGDSMVPISAPSHYGGSGIWSRPDADVDAVDITEWVTPSSAAAADSDVQVPLPDFAADPRVFVQCSGDQLILQGAEAPFGSSWTRTG
ncbi:MAG TPA: hypothetical protein VL294_04510 [Pseudolysinimonas sp.]|jgi:hypothetical protein|nr:hypothetical protein [Pseudolysinimonas sp.]